MLFLCNYLMFIKVCLITRAESSLAQGFNVSYIRTTNEPIRVEFEITILARLYMDQKLKRHVLGSVPIV